MHLITRKSECRNRVGYARVLSPKQAIRRTLSEFEIRDGLVVRRSDVSYVSPNEIVINGVALFNGVSIYFE